MRGGGYFCQVVYIFFYKYLTSMHTFRKLCSYIRRINHYNWNFYSVFFSYKNASLKKNSPLNRLKHSKTVYSIGNIDVFGKFSSLIGNLFLYWMYGPPPGACQSSTHAVILHITMVLMYSKDIWQNIKVWFALPCLCFFFLIWMDFTCLKWFFIMEIIIIQNVISMDFTCLILHYWNDNKLKMLVTFIPQKIIIVMTVIVKYNRVFFIDK